MVRAALKARKQHRARDDLLRAQRHRRDRRQVGQPQQRNLHCPGAHRGEGRRLDGAAWERGGKGCKARRDVWGLMQATQNAAASPSAGTPASSLNPKPPSGPCTDGRDVEARHLGREGGGAGLLEAACLHLQQRQRAAARRHQHLAGAGGRQVDGAAAGRRPLRDEARPAGVDEPHSRRRDLGRGGRGGEGRGGEGLRGERADTCAAGPRGAATQGRFRPSHRSRPRTCSSVSCSVLLHSSVCRALSKPASSTSPSSSSSSMASNWAWGGGKSWEGGRIAGREQRKGDGTAAGGSGSQGCSTGAGAPPRPAPPRAAPAPRRRTRVSPTKAMTSRRS
jgi:hypothetical protein